MAQRDDFTAAVKDSLADRVGNRCSNPDCGAPTSGPHAQPEKAVNLGVAAHITAAAPGGPRFDATLTQTQRAGALNGIWLCQICAKLIDNDVPRFPVELLRQWKGKAEKIAQDRLGKAATPVSLEIADQSQPAGQKQPTAPSPRERWLRAVIDAARRRRVLAGIATGLGVDMEAIRVPIRIAIDRDGNTILPSLVDQLQKARPNTRLVIVGDVGTGKTELLYETAARLAERALEDAETPLPILLKARDLAVGFKEAIQKT